MSKKNPIGAQTPIAPSPSRAAKSAVDLSSQRSQVFDHQIRRSAGTDHGFKKVDSGRAELVVSRITATISIARQGPSAFLSLPAVPPYAARVHAWCKSSAKTYCNSQLAAKQWLAAFRGELQ
jgi:hypothetical protein